jgi:integrase/recombinase XerD
MSRAQSIALEMLIQIYLDELKVRGYKPKTINGYRKNLKTFLKWSTQQGTTTLVQFDAGLVKVYMRYLHDKPCWSQMGYEKPSTRVVGAGAIRDYVRDLKTFASWLYQEHYTHEHVLASVRLPKVDETPIISFTDDELDTIFGSLDPTDAFDLRDYVLLHTLWDTGMRVGEFLDGVDLRACQIRIQHAKFGKWRDIGIGRETHKYLTRYLTLCRPQVAIEGTQQLFLSLDGYPTSEGAVQKMCRRHSKRTGIHIHAYRFRHTFAV